MYLLIKVGDATVLEKMRAYLSSFGLWFKEFNDPEYRVDVSAEERSQVLHNRGCRGSINPIHAWETCNSFVQAWDFDLSGRIWPKDEDDIKRCGDTAPEGKGWVIEDGKKIRVAGECANPRDLNHIYCYMWCTKYEPMSIDAAIFVAEQVIQEHERRVQVLRRHIEYLKTTNLLYREAIKTGGVFEYKEGKFVISQS
ncbi:MAG: hypothetical protein HZB12_00575 [Candidatus Yonathbacteria bacterium]|nr:hypothetical protein [Candidatus Yonathbacteria bacterium]